MVKKQSKKIKSELMRIDKELANTIRKKQETIQQMIKIDISLPQASRSLFEEYRKFKLNNNKSIKF